MMKDRETTFDARVSQAYAEYALTRLIPKWEALPDEMRNALRYVYAKGELAGVRRATEPLR